MMRPVIVNVSRAFAMPPMATYTRNATGGVSLNWIDGTAVNPADPLTWGSPEAEVGFRVEKAATFDKKGAPLTWTTVAAPLANQTSYTDASLTPDQAATYRVVAFNAAGDSAAMPILVGPSVVTDPKTGLTTPVVAPLAPTTLVSTLQFGPKVVLTWSDLALNETGFVLERATGAGAFVVVATPGAVDKAGTYTDTSVTGGNTYTYRIKAVNGGGESAYSNTASVSIMPAPAAPSNLVVTGAVTLKKESSVTLSWIDNSANESGFVLERATDAGFTANLVSTNVGPNVVTTTQTRLLPATVYYFRIKAINLGGSSGWTSTVVMTPP